MGFHVPDRSVVLAGMAHLSPGGSSKVLSGESQSYAVEEEVVLLSTATSGRVSFFKREVFVVVAFRLNNR